MYVVLTKAIFSLLSEPPLISITIKHHMKMTMSVSGNIYSWKFQTITINACNGNVTDQVYKLFIILNICNYVLARDRRLLMVSSEYFS